MCSDVFNDYASSVMCSLIISISPLLRHRKGGYTRFMGCYDPCGRLLGLQSLQDGQSPCVVAQGKYDPWFAHNEHPMSQRLANHMSTGLPLAYCDISLLQHPHHSRTKTSNSTSTMI